MAIISSSNIEEATEGVMKDVSFSGERYLCKEIMRGSFLPLWK